MTTRRFSRSARIASARIASVCALGVGLLCNFAAVAADDVKLPRSMVWTAYDLGSAGYTEASGIANSLQTHYPTRIRIIPSGTSIGRLLPMSTGRVKYAFLGNEAYFASEASFDFAAKSWGPQDLRVLMGRPSPIGIAYSNCKDRPIKTMADVKGTRIGYVKGNPSVNVKNDALIAFAGYTRDDIQPVWFGGWGQQVPALLAGQIDGMNNVPTSGQVRQIEASSGGLCWPEMDPNDKEGWARVQAVASFLNPVKATAGAGLSEENPKWLAGYRYPLISTYASTSADEVYNLMKAMHLHFDDYKTTTAASKGWAMAVGGRPPYDAPTHEGAVRYLKEIGVWTDEDEAWNQKRLARAKRVQEAWEDAQAGYEEWRAQEREKGNKVDDDEAWVGYWEKYRAE
ncbi:MAG: TAXI family TRAP transporter solute-binding subunit, partial [Gammaproteobacteria bacterium]|nr:TAXI family TRAP transporter solute-binding subunit [Gammaproteobacteria bacterium]